MIGRVHKVEYKVIGDAIWLTNSRVTSNWWTNSGDLPTLLITHVEWQITAFNVGD